MSQSACLIAGGLLVIFFLLPAPAQAEESSVSTVDGSSTDLFLQLKKGLDVDGWSGEVNSVQSFGKGGMLILKERLDVRLHRIPGYRRQWKINQSMDLHFDQPVSETSGLVGLLSHQDYRDQLARRYDGKAVGPPFQNPLEPGYIDLGASLYGNRLERIRKVHLGLGGRFITDEGLSIEGIVGPVLDERGGVSQDGVQYDFDLGFETDSLSVSSKGWFSHFGSGDDYNLKAALEGGYQFSEAADNEFGVSYLTGSRREFTALNPVIGRREDRRMELTNVLRMRSSEDLTFSWESNLLSRSSSSRSGPTLRDDSEFNWRNDFTGVWTQEARFASLTGGVDAQQQEYAGGLTQGRNNRLQFSGGLRPDISDSIVFVGALAKYRFDTPDELDFNDRDELRWRGSLHGGKQLTTALGIRAGLDADLNHLVYIHRTRSGENRWTRLFTLWSEVPWSQGFLENNSRFSVSAHYTEYDYSPFDLTQSRLFRTFSAGDTLRLNFDHGWGLELSGLGQLDDHGELNWGEWIQNVSEEGYSYAVALLPFFKWGFSEVAAGWLFYRRQTTILQDDGKSTPGQDIRSTGPIAKAILRPSLRTRVEFHATLLTIRRDGRETDVVPDVNLTFARSW